MRTTFPSVAASLGDMPPRVRALTLALVRTTALHTPVEVLAALVEVLAWTIARRAAIGEHDLEWIAPVVEICAHRATDRACALYAVSLLEQAR
jgi:hypothetical protein